MEPVSGLPMKVISLVVLFGLGAIAPPPAASQQPDSVRESAEVALVEVPVRVVDRDGHPVRGLKETDFTVFDDGARQPIVAFDAIDLADRGTAGGDPVHPAARRRFLILFDLSFSQPRSIVAARKAARDFVLTGMGERDLAAVATYSVESGVRLLVTFSSDRAQLARAIDTLGFQSSRETSDPLAFAFDFSNVVGIATARSGSRADIEGLVETLQTYSILGKARADEYARGRVRVLFQAFRELSRALDTVEGRKDVIYLSEGFNGRYLVGTRETEEERQYLLHGEVWKVDADKRFGSAPLRNELNDVGDFFRRSDCVIHAVDIGGIRAEGEPEGESASVGPRETENSLYAIAQVTGGEVFRNTNDLGAQLARLVNQTNLVYVLAFRAERSSREGGYHELKVKVSAPGARVLARAGYYERRGFRQLSPLERRLLAADVIANEIAVDDIPSRVLAMPFSTGGSTANVPVLLEVPGAPLLAAEKGDRLTVEIYVYATDENGGLRDFFARTISADLMKSREKLMASGLRYYGELRLPPGVFRLRTLVRNANTGHMGLTVSEVRVPAFASAEPYLLPPVFLEGSGDWILVQGAGKASPNDSPGPNPFFALAMDGLSPAALPRVWPGGAARLCLVAYHFGRPGGPDDLKIGSQILDEGGQPVESVRLAVLAMTAPDTDGKRTLVASFAAPAGLARGRYSLRVFLQDGTAGPARQATTPFLVP
jgi:VWFA-related protein